MGKLRVTENLLDSALRKVVGGPVLAQMLE